MANELILLFSKPNNWRGGKLAMWILNQHEAGMLTLTASQSTCLLMILNIQKAHLQLASFLFIAMEDAWPLCYIPIPDYKNV